MSTTPQKSKKALLILGIDPGTAVTGYGVIRCDSKEIKLVALGSIKTTNNHPYPQRLYLIYRQLFSLLSQHQPHILAMESLFFNTNVKSALRVGQAMGVIKLAAAKRKIKVVEYPPLKIKMKLVGNGRAKKRQIQSGVRKILGIRRLPRPTHAADALAVAICHWLEIKQKKGGEKEWEKLS